MIAKLNSKQLEEIIKIAIKNASENKDYFTDEILKDEALDYAKKEVADYLQLPDLFNYE